jgi:hypothetical protein
MDMKDLLRHAAVRVEALNSAIIRTTETVVDLLDTFQEVLEDAGADEYETSDSSNADATGPVDNETHPNINIHLNSPQGPSDEWIEEVLLRRLNNKKPPHEPPPGPEATLLT